MKKIVPLILISSFLFSCGEAPENKNNQNSDQLKSQSAEPNKKNASADYSSLLTNYSCDMDIAELSNAMEIAASDIVKTNSRDQVKKTLDLSEAEMSTLDKNKLKNDDECTFEIEGYGVDNFGNNMLLSLRSSKMPIEDIRKNIKGYLDRREEGLEKITKMYIVEADTKDSYIATQLRYGRVIIYNENHDGAFVISYGINNANNDRTQEQHEALTRKMVRLANYLLNKHGK